MAAEDSITELRRCIENIIRMGVIAELDLGNVRCRVQSGNLKTTWLPFFVRRAGDVRHWSPPSIGEQCIVLSPGGDLCAGSVLVGLHSTAIPPADSSAHTDSTTYPDGAVIKYDHAASTLTATLPSAGQAVINAPVSITINTQQLTVNASQAITLNTELLNVNAPISNVNGAFNVQGLFTFLAGMAGSGVGPSGKAAAIEGSLNATENLTANGIPLVGHHHGGVRSGPDISAEASA